MFNDEFFENLKSTIQKSTENLAEDMEAMIPRIQKKVDEEFERKETEQDQLNKMLYGVFNGSIIIK